MLAYHDNTPTGNPYDPIIFFQRDWLTCREAVVAETICADVIFIPFIG